MCLYQSQYQLLFLLPYSFPPDTLLIKINYNCIYKITQMNFTYVMLSIVNFSFKIYKCYFHLLNCHFSLQHINKQKTAAVFQPRRHLILLLFRFSHIFSCHFFCTVSYFFIHGFQIHCLYFITTFLCCHVCKTLFCSISNDFFLFFHHSFSI